MSYNVLGIAAGMGVSLYPAKDRVIGNVEPRAIFHTPKNIQWTQNFPNTFLMRELPDVEQLPGVNVIVSSPDCGSGSVLRLSVSKSLGDIKTNNSLMMFFRSVRKYKPDFFYFENLPAMFKSLSLKKFQKKVKKYNLVVHEASVCMWGNSQIHRKRLVIVGIRKDMNCNFDHLFRLPDYRHANKTCFDLYGDLDLNNSDLKRYVELGHLRESVFDVVTVYSKFKCTVAQMIRYWETQGKGKKRWEVEGRRFSNAPGVYRNRKNDYPATARKANRQFDHNGLMLTPRQLARIQGVPDDFKIYIDPDKLNYWINKGRAAVTKTPPMEISTWFFNKLNKFYGTK